MKKLLFLAFLLGLSAVSLFALTIPQGRLYFDNSKTQYNTIRFVYGSESTTYVRSMTQDGNKWYVDIPQNVYNMYRFTFVGGSIGTGTYQQGFSAFKDSVSLQLEIYRTATSEAQMKANDIFVPENGDNWAQGSWMTLSAWESSQTVGTATISGTLPVVYINTENNAPIVSKDEYLPGALYIDALSTGYEALGTAETPVTGQFKGRGNWTWNGFDKKPYRIKLDVKQKVLGMPSNKHWCLMAHADDNLGYLRNYAGYMLSEQIGLRWTPKTVPVELVLNGAYQGLYFLTEQVRISGKRVNITEQEDNATDSVSGGWLVEIDNYEEEGNVEFWEGNGQRIWVTMKSPEILSEAQRNYVTGQLLSINNALYGSSASTLWSLLDLDEAVKYYLVQELLEDCESYHGSCYLYKDRDRNGQQEKWFFGPVWDFGNAYMRGWDTWIYDQPQFAQYWIGQLATWPEFQNRLQEIWYVFYHDQLETVRTQINQMAALLTDAAPNDGARWRNTQNYCDNSNMSAKRDEFMNRFNHRTQWLYSQWGEGIQPTQLDVEKTQEEPSQGRKILRDGQLYIERNGQIYTVQGSLVD